MKPINILVPVDDSTPARNAAKYAGSLATQHNAKVILLHVYDAISQLISGDGLKQVRQKLEDDSETLLNEFQKNLAECDVKAEKIIRSGDVAKEILLVAKEKDCDLIVMGSRGRNALQGAFLGSAVTKVLQHSECPVLVTRNLRKLYPGQACFK